MRIQKIEYHQVNSYFTYEIDDEDIIAEFGSIEKFEEAYAEESDDFWEFVQDFVYNREDDWWTDRKGGYDVEWSIED